MNYMTDMHPLYTIGAGAFGEVKKCSHHIHGDVAAKFFYESNFPDKKEWAAACDRALAEGRFLQSLGHHNVVRIFDVVVSPKRDEISIIMEYCKNGSAGSLTGSNKIYLPNSRLIIRDGAMGLRYIHSKGHLHRDVKPDNILLTSENEAKVGDFGFVTDKLVSGFANGYGTPQYLAPEVYVHGLCSALSDIYSIGVTFLHLLCGELWFTRSGPGRWFNIDRSGLPILSDGLFLPHVPVQWRNCTKRLIEKDSARRCQSMDEAVNIISRLPSVEDWHCEVKADIITWNLSKGNRVVKVEWSKYLRLGEEWQAWSENAGGGSRRTLARSTKSDTWKKKYRDLQAFFAARRP